MEWDRGAVAQIVDFLSPLVDISMLDVSDRWAGRSRCKEDTGVNPETVFIIQVQGLVQDRSGSRSRLY